MDELGLKRVYYDAYENDSQADLLDEARDSPDSFIGLLRLDSFVASQLALPDSYIFDGALLLSRSPNDFEQLLGRTDYDPVIPLRIYQRAGSLSASLAELLYLRDGSALNYYMFFSIRDVDVRHRVAEAISNTKPRKLEKRIARAGSVATGVGLFVKDIIADVGGDASAFDPIVDGWHKWIESEGRIDTRIWSGRFDLAGSLDFVDERVFATGPGKELYSKVQSLLRPAARTGGQGRVMAQIHEAETQSGLDAEQSFEIRTIRDWYERGYHRAIARHHSVDFCSTLGRDIRPIGESSVMLDSVEPALDTSSRFDRIDVPVGLLERIGSVEGRAYRRMLFEQRHDLCAWWGEEDVSALRRSVDALLEVCDRYGASPSSSSTVTQLVRTTMKAGAGVGVAIVSPSLSVVERVALGGSITWGLDRIDARVLTPADRRLRRRRVVETLKNWVPNAPEAAFGADDPEMT